MKTHTVLLVDDDADIRETVAEALDDAGYHVQRAANGKQALDCLRTSPFPCIILLDLMMPVMDGYEFRATQRSEAALASIPVVVISAGGGYKEAAAAMGAVAALKKPFKLKDLFVAVEQSVELVDARGAVARAKRLRNACWRDRS